MVGGARGRGRGGDARLTVVERRADRDVSGPAAAFQGDVGRRVAGGRGKALQVVMLEGRTLGRHDGRDAEVRHLVAAFPLGRHPGRRRDSGQRSEVAAPRPLSGSSRLRPRKLHTRALGTRASISYVSGRSGISRWLL
jgi:hypothetical protein